MAIHDFKCKYCGGELESFDGSATVGKCIYCGSRQTLPKLFSDTRATLFERANHFRRSNAFDKAEALYEQILNEDPTDPEAYWSIVLCRYGIEYVEDPRTKQRIPTVNRTQFTPIFADEDYKCAIKYATQEQKELYVAEAETIDTIQKGILDISRKEEPFDIFICYKETDDSGKRTRDSVLAQELYHELTRDGYKVFFAKVTLQGKLGSAYEPYIFSALNSAKVMVVLGTKPEHFEAVWVRNEWSRFLSMIKNGERKVLIPAYRDMDAYDMPVEFAHLQALDMSRLGFMQDLIDGIEKIADHSKTVTQRRAPEPEFKKPEPEPIIKPQPEIKKPESSRAAAPTPPKKKRPIVLIAVILACAIIIGVLAIALGSNSQNNNENSEPEITTIEETTTAEETQTYSEGLEFAKNGDGYSVTDIGSCTDTDIVIPSTYNGKPVTSIGYAAFFDCSNLTSITIPDSVTSIGADAFACCSKLTSIAIPDSVTSIGGSAFYGCSNLTSITIPDSVTSISSAAFSDCSNLTSITVGINNTAYKSLDGNLYTKDGKTLLQYAIGKTVTSFTIPDSVTSIGDGAFEYCSKLTSITIPDSVTSIDGYAFSDCSSLTIITIPDSVTSIGGWAFEDCSSLTSVTFGENSQLTSIGADAFYGCSNLTSITIPDSVTSIGADAFRDCSLLTSITIPEGVTSIGQYAFYECFSLTTVYYTGTQDQWNNISIGNYNDDLISATKVYNYVAE